jgi:hypothetical protein
MATSQVSPLIFNVPIVYPAGHPQAYCPTPAFSANIQQWLVEKAVTDGLAAGAAVAGDAAASGLTATTKTLLGNKETTTGPIEELTITQVLDLIAGTAARGDILFRGASAWSRLAAGTAGKVLQTNGGSADPTWVTPTAQTKLTILQLQANATKANNTFAKESWASGAVILDEVTAWASGSPTRLTTPSGYTRARITGNASWAANSVGARWINIYKQGTFIKGALHAAANESRATVVTRWLTGLTTSDYFEIEFAQSSGGNLNLTGSATNNADAADFQIEWAP